MSDEIQHGSVTYWNDRYASSDRQGRPIAKTVKLIAEWNRCINFGVTSWRRWRCLLSSPSWLA